MSEISTNNKDKLQVDIYIADLFVIKINILISIKRLMKDLFQILNYFLSFLIISISEKNLRIDMFAFCKIRLLVPLWAPNVVCLESPTRY